MISNASKVNTPFDGQYVLPPSDRLRAAAVVIEQAAQEGTSAVQLLVGTAFGTDLSEAKSIGHHLKRLNMRACLLPGPFTQTSKPGVESSSLSGPVPHGRKASRYPCGIPTFRSLSWTAAHNRPKPPESVCDCAHLADPPLEARVELCGPVSACWPLAAFPAVASDFLASGTFGRSGRWAGLERDSLRGETGEQRAPPFPVLPSLS